MDAAFDVLVPEFGIEKRVHVDQMPIDVCFSNSSLVQATHRRHSQNHVYDEHSHTLQIYWSDRDVLTWLAENSDDEHLKKVKENAEQQHAVKMEVASRSVHDEKALFNEDDGDDEIVLGRDNVEVEEEEVESVQREISKTKVIPEFEGLKTTPAGHKIQHIKELMTVPVRVFCLMFTPRLFR